MQDLQTDEAILAELGQRIRAARLARNVSQIDLAREAGIGRVTLQRIEDGSSSSLTSLIRVLRALKLLSGLDAIVPEQPQGPVDLFRRGGRERLRASPAREGTRPVRWRWGDEEVR